MSVAGVLRGHTEPRRARMALMQGGDAALVTLEAEFGLAVRGVAIAFDPVAMPSAELLCALASGAGSARREDDRFGLRWVTLSGGDPDDLPVTLGAIAEAVAQAGCAEQLVCAVFAFEGCVYLTYNFARAAFHVFVPCDGGGRDGVREQRIEESLGRDLHLEHDADRRYPLWDMPL